MIKCENDSSSHGIQGALISRDSNHYRQSVSAGKTNAIPTEPSGRLRHSGRTQSPLSGSFLSIIVIGSCRAPLQCMLLSKLCPMRSS